jgi:hypothetical protein
MWQQKLSSAQLFEKLGIADDLVQLSLMVAITMIPQHAKMPDSLFLSRIYLSIFCFCSLSFIASSVTSLAEHPTVALDAYSASHVCQHLEKQGFPAEAVVAIRKAHVTGQMILEGGISIY